MVMQLLGQFDKFCPTHESWEQYVDRVEHFLDTGVIEDAVKNGILCSVVIV